MDIRYRVAIMAAKASKIVSRLLHRSGTSLPGMVALKFDPQILGKLAKGVSVILVTGTNGKTTTTGMISAILDSAGLKHIVNKSGANLIEGIITTFIDGTDILGRSSTNLALIEIDEATVGILANSVQPELLVVTNFFRDQLDRYGELHSVVNKIKSGISRFPKAKLVLNADDSLCASLGVDVANETVFFGVEANAVPPSAEENITTTSYCVFCHEKYIYPSSVPGVLGEYQCPGCGFKRPHTQVSCTQVNELEAMSSIAQFQTDDQTYTVKIAVPGMYNVYNALAAVTCCHAFEIPVEKAVGALEKFEGRFGRMEIIPAADNKKIMLILSKNPAGFNQTINYLSVGDKTLNVSFVINDRDQDGVDVSWLWDVDFEKMGNLESRLAVVYASGLRAEDMALRLEYAGVPTKKIQTIKEYRPLIETGLASISAGETFYIVATYTAMMDIRRILKHRYGLKEIWQ